MAVQVRPAGFAMQQQKNVAITGAFVDEVHAQRIDLHVVGAEFVSGQIFKTLVGRAQDLHQSCTLYSLKQHSPS